MGWVLTVVADHQQCVLVLGAVDNRVGHLLLQPAAVLGLVRRVLRQLRGTHDEADFGQSAIAGPVVEVFQSKVGHAALGERGILRGVLELLEPGQRVVVKVVRVLVDLPVDSSILVVLVDGLPLERVAIDTRALAA